MPIPFESGRTSSNANSKARVLPSQASFSTPFSISRHRRFQGRPGTKPVSPPGHGGRLPLCFAATTVARPLNHVP